MLVTELGMVTEVRLLQYSNAPRPMLVTELGMVTEVNPLKPDNRYDGITLTLLPKFTVQRLSQTPKTDKPPLPAYVQLSALKFSVVNLIQ